MTMPLLQRVLQHYQWMGILTLVEFLCGVLLAMGLLTPLCCLLLSGDMVVAVGTSVLPRIKASSPADWLAAVL
jgi:uncharacterized membrane protein YphA (DoxX/SURF4 family)